MKTELIITADGSHSLFVPELNEHYHSTNGAMQESMHIYIDAGFKYCNKKDINILEIGFGTGLNALLTYIESKNINTNVYYHSIELYPVDIDMAINLNYSSLLNISNDIFNTLHKCEWNIDVAISNNFKIHKENADILNVQYNNMYDLVYFDAFAPSKQSEVWNKEIFQRIYNAMNNKGILVTYSTSGNFKRDLKEIGFNIELLPGPTGKRHILRAINN